MAVRRRAKLAACSLTALMAACSSPSRGPSPLELVEREAARCETRLQASETHTRGLEGLLADARSQLTRKDGALQSCLTASGEAGIATSQLQAEITRLERQLEETRGQLAGERNQRQKLEGVLASLDRAVDEAGFWQFDPPELAERMRKEQSLLVKYRRAREMQDSVLPSWFEDADVRRMVEFEPAFLKQRIDETVRVVRLLRYALLRRSQGAVSYKEL
ncbi:MAG: hypothetical protein KDF64_22115 [Geminicoccaceae bacterium]|nr:hypothetical protein [Geminicoccaceae bacterium]